MTREATRVADGAPASDALAEVREQAVELLARLERPPRNLRIETGTITIDIAWDDEAPAAPVPPPAVPAAEPGRTAAADGTGARYLTSPAVGVFYHAREPGAEPFVSVGATVRPGQQIGIVEAMKLMIPVEADRAGTVTAVVKEDGEPVEYGEPLFALEAGED
ncbi:acetyl-CoA carboxylase biotin carboxyl carrier protein [Spirillospora sp. CA-294931]|uniref:acetyl-CoA carboxylase biotin carboxyl carrier protein n=1 Tax=Spirillospora sp. CA-294931 TaxID=3240042 RepID=UPI003D943880